MNQRQTLVAGAILGALGVALGAFGAHALKNALIQNGRLETYELAVRYQYYHAFVMLITGLAMEKCNQASIRWASLLILVGVVLFSGSLYFFAFTNIASFAMVTPIGGVFMLVGWIMLAYSFIRNK